MPELWAEFDPPEAPDPHGEDYFDLMPFATGVFDALYEAENLEHPHDMIGVDKIEHDAIAARRPPEARTEWSPSMANWQDPQIGLDWIAGLRYAIADWPDTDDRDYMFEQLDVFERVMLRAKAAGLRFRLFIGG